MTNFKSFVLKINKLFKRKLQRVKCFKYFYPLVSPRQYRTTLVNLLTSGEIDLARNYYFKNKKISSLDPDFDFLISRYFDSKSLSDESKSAIAFTRDLLQVSHSKSRPPSYISVLEDFKNIIVVSNNSLLRFEKQEQFLLKNLEKPLFIYLNIGNSSICEIRNKFYNVNTKEILVGGHHHIVDSEHKLFFKPFSEKSFLGCLVRVNSRFQKLWFNELRHKAMHANPSIDFFEIKETLLIESAYPFSVYQDKNKLKKRIPTIGWLIIALLDSISSSSVNDGPNIWLAGFSLSPSYIFQASGNMQQHDFCLEKETLKYRLLQKSFNTVGIVLSNQSEISTQQQLNASCPGRIQLSKHLRENGAI